MVHWSSWKRGFITSHIRVLQFISKRWGVTVIELYCYLTGEIHAAKVLDSHSNRTTCNLISTQTLFKKNKKKPILHPLNHGYFLGIHNSINEYLVKWFCKAINLHKGLLEGIVKKYTTSDPHYHLTNNGYQVITIHNRKSSTALTTSKCHWRKQNKIKGNKIKTTSILFFCI